MSSARRWGLDWKTSSLINAGTGICGGSAIAAIAPVIEATDMDIAYGMSATFLLTRSWSSCSRCSAAR